MSKAPLGPKGASSISYGVRPEDDGSDMDVSSDDEGLHMYQPLLNHTVQPSSAAAPGSDSSSSRFITSTTVEIAKGSKAAASSDWSSSSVIRDEASDNDSTTSYYTAPNSPIDLTLDDDQDTDMDRRQLAGIIDELSSEQDRLTRELEYHSNEEERIARLLEEKKAKLEAMRVQILEYQVRKSIQKNRKAVITPAKSKSRKAVITPAKSKKGKERAPIDDHYRSFSESEEEDTLILRRKAIAIMDLETQKPVRQPAGVELSGQIVKNKKVQEETTETRTKKALDVPQPQHDASIIKEEAAPETTRNLPHAMSIPKQNKLALQTIKRSQQLGNTSVGQMKVFLCDLYDKFLEDGRLSRVQRVHYKELVEQVSKFSEFGNNFIPRKTTTKKGKKVQPETHCMLPDEFYGHPKELDFRNFKVDESKLLDALTCSEIEAPRILVEARNLLSKQAFQLKLSDFDGVIGPDGKIVEEEELKMYIGIKKIKRLLALYREVVSGSASATSMTTGQRARHEYYIAQRRLEESVMRQNGTASPEPSTVVNPLVSDNSTDALNSARVFLVPSSKAADAKPITTITYIPNETSFIRSILPGGRASANSQANPSPQKPKAVQQSKPQLPQPKAPKAPKALKAPKASTRTPVKNTTSKPASAQIPTIPKNPPSSKLSDNRLLSAPNTSSSSSTYTQASHSQPSAPAIRPPQPNMSSSFQPYRSALDSLGVTRSVAARPGRTGVLCRAESNGGTCNDKTCRDMHFADFTNN